MERSSNGIADFVWGEGWQEQEAEKVKKEIEGRKVREGRRTRI